MKTKIKGIKKTLALVLVILLCLINLDTYATSNTSAPAALTLGSSQSSIKEGDSVVLDLKLTNITLSSGISSVSLNLDLDENIFEIVRRVDIKEESGWTMTYNSSTKLLKLTTTQKVKNDTSLAKISLKAKSTFGTQKDITSANATMITLKNIKINLSRDIDNVSVKLNLNGTELPTLPGGSNTEKPSENTEPKVNPKAGLDNAYIIGIISLGCIAVLSVIGHKKVSGKIG